MKLVRMSLILKRGDQGRMEMFMSHSDIASFSHRHKRLVNERSLVPKIKSNVYVMYDEWLTQYKDFLLPFVDDMYVLISNHGVHLDYNGFKTDMFRYIYQTSDSRYLGFTFLER